MSELPAGYAGARDIGDDFSALSFVIRQMIGQTATATLVRVLAINRSDIAPVGYLDCQPLVQQMDGAGRAQAPAILHNLPWFRLQGGVNAVILDPAVGDIGIAVFASHDISRVKNTRATGLPGSRRRFDWGDGLYLGGFLNGTPQNYVRFDSNGDIHLKPASKLHVEGDVQVTGDVTASGISLTGHVHSGVQTGSGTSGGPA
jgi:hypothetical protein